METFHTDGMILTEIDLGPYENHAELFTNESDFRHRLVREERISRRDELNAFVDTTDFEKAYLAVIMWIGAPRTSTVELINAERSDDAIHFEIQVDRSDGFETRDIGAHSLLIRVEDNDVPENAMATVHDPEG